MAKKDTGDTTPKQRGRPTKFTKSIADKICERLATGETLRQICRDVEFPQESTVRQWAALDYNGFYAQYVRARDIGLDAMADEILDIADTPVEGVVKTQKANGTEIKTGDMIEHRRLQVDSRKWYLSKLAPKRYDKPQVDNSQDHKEPDEDYTVPLKIDEDAPTSPIL